MHQSAHGKPNAAKHSARGRNVSLLKLRKVVLGHSERGESLKRLNTARRGSQFRTGLERFQPPTGFQAEYEGSIPFTRSSLRSLRGLRLGKPCRGEGCGVA
jgi:hypothetical protein